MVFSDSFLPGASVRNSARGTGHEEGGLAYAKVYFCFYSIVPGD